MFSALVLTSIITSVATFSLIEKFRKGDSPKVGPQINRNHAEGPQGRTSLKGYESQPITRDFVSAKKQWEEARAKVNPPPK